MINSGNKYHEFAYSVSQVNEWAKKNPKQMITQIEKTYREDIAEIAQKVMEEGDVKVIMLAGPSSSGKTTTAYFLRDEMKKQGGGATIISLDDFYLGRGKAPRLQNGQFDYEALEALDVTQLRECLTSLIQNRMCKKPTFDFVSGNPFPEKEEVRLGEHDIAILEGIHALNPAITGHMPKSGLLRLYISVKEGISKEGGGWALSPQSIRFVRRLVRDFYHRGDLPGRTVSTWEQVCRGEALYIQPYKHTSDITINSLHVYEPCVMRNCALMLLDQIPEDHPSYDFVERVTESLRRFVPLSEELVPPDSMLREFLAK